ncbi:MAG: hypothetical protein J6Z35_09590, partial [Lachnospiraceae bacterium]|nr:hypothetical protein [Lachnospiraceae bacterium]
GKYLGRSVPACGFSIGFERIITILLEQDFTVPQKGSKVAFLVEKGMDRAQTDAVFVQAEEQRRAGNTVLMVRMAKNKKFQKEQLAADGYTEIKEFFKK